MPPLTRQTKITFGDMRGGDVRGVPVLLRGLKERAAGGLNEHDPETYGAGSGSGS